MGTLPHLVGFRYIDPPGGGTSWATPFFRFFFIFFLISSFFRPLVDVLDRSLAEFEAARARAEERILREFFDDQISMIRETVEHEKWD